MSESQPQQPSGSTDWGNYIALGNIYKDRSKYAQAKEQYEKALELAQRINSRKGEAESLLGIAAIYNCLSQSWQAIEYLALLN